MCVIIIIKSYDCGLNDDMILQIIRVDLCIIEYK